MNEVLVESPYTHITREYKLALTKSRIVAVVFDTQLSPVFARISIIISTARQQFQDIFKT